MVKRLLLIATLVMAAAAAAAPGAAAKGAGVLPAPAGVTLPGSPYRYVAIHPKVGVPGVPTIVERIDRSDGRIDRWWRLQGHYFIPAVAYDLSGGGLSADGRTLVLQRFTSAYPPQRSRFAVLNTAVHLRHPVRPGEDRPLHAVRRIDLPGFFSFDAISPDGSIVYLIHHLPARGPAARYEVRALDTTTGRLFADPIVDPEEPEERMEGLPITRAMSPDGRWAYTLYDGNGKEPFLHALDTVRGSAVCVDLPQLRNRRNLFLLTLGLAAGGRRLVVRSESKVQGGPLSPRLLTVDTRTFAVHRPAPVAEASSASSVPWLPIGAGAAALAAALIWLLVRRERTADRRPLEQG